jgi:hypothetical protein
MSDRDKNAEILALRHQTLNGSDHRSRVEQVDSQSGHRFDVGRSRGRLVKVCLQRSCEIG